MNDFEPKLVKKSYHLAYKKEKRPIDKKLREKEVKIFVLYFITIFIMAILSHKMIDRDLWVVIRGGKVDPA